MKRLRIIAASLLALSIPAGAAAQQNLQDVLSFLLANRSINTDDPARDQQAAEATRDAITQLLQTQLETLPTSSSATGFTYREDPDLGGIVARSSPSFGPFFVERSLTAGARRPSVGITYQDAVFDKIDGRNLRDGTLVATASRFRGDTKPFDVETVALSLRTHTITLSGNLGLTDRLDVGAAVPFIRLTLSGQRIDTLRGAVFPQAQANASASGVGDIVLRGKYNVMRRGGNGVAIGAEMTLPTGAEENLLGSGETVVRPRVVVSHEGARIGVHGDAGYSVGGFSRQLDYAAAVTVAATPRVTVGGELLGHRFAKGGRLTETTLPNPQLIGVDTIRLTSVTAATERVLAIAGVKWNVASSMILNASVLRPITDAGLNPAWVPVIALEYSLGR